MTNRFNQNCFFQGNPSSPIPSSYKFFPIQDSFLIPNIPLMSPCFVVIKPFVYSTFFIQAPTVFPFSPLISLVPFQPFHQFSRLVIPIVPLPLLSSVTIQNSIPINPPSSESIVVPSGVPLFPDFEVPIVPLNVTKECTEPNYDKLLKVNCFEFNIFPTPALVSYVSPSYKTETTCTTPIVFSNVINNSEN